MLAAIAATTVGQLPVFLVGSLAPQIRQDLAFSASMLGIAVAAFFASSALCSATLGRFSDRFGGQTIMRLGVLPVVCGGLAIGLGVHTVGGLIAALVVSGIANGVIQPAANRYLAGYVPAGRQGFAFGVKQAAIPAATLLSGLAVPAVGSTVGWRWAFIGLGVLAVAVGLLIPWRGSSPKRAVASGTNGPQLGLRSSRTALVTLAIGMGAGSAAVNALGSFFVSSAVHIGISGSVAGLTAAAGSITSMATRLTIGFLADQRSTGHLRLAAMLSAVGSIGLILLALQSGWLLLIAAILGYGAGWGWAGLFNFAVVRIYPGAAGWATGIIQTGGSTGACLGPLSFAMIVDYVGYQPAWLTGAALLLIAAAIILAGRRAFYTVGVLRH